jgi:hypothetical protein
LCRLPAEVALHLEIKQLIESRHLLRSLIDGLKAPNDDAARGKLWTAAKDAASKALASCGDAPETAAVGELVLQATRLSAQAGKFDEIYTGLAALPLEKSATLTADLAQVDATHPDHRQCGGGTSLARQAIATK